METLIKTKKLAGISKTGQNMEKKSKGTAAQKRYRDKLKEINNINAKFMAFASEEPPELVKRFFEGNKVSNINEIKAKNSTNVLQSFN